MSPSLSRRRFLGSVGVAGVASVAGCLDGTSVPGSGDGDLLGTDGNPPPARETGLYQPWDLDRVSDATVSGGPGKDGIPSIDSPQFAPASDVSFPDDRVVFGYAGESDVKAYSQHILVWHEIANDVLDGTNVAVTYCPLTGTAMGFERGDTTFGVSGRLVNNNLVMYDRATDSRWPQILAAAVSGPQAGDQLREFRLVWTTWGQWRRAHPDTEIMTENTGYSRRYGGDPYGNYNPDTGYYASFSQPLFPSLDEGYEETQEDAKRVVVGTRTADRAVAFDKPTLREETVLATDDGALVAVYDSTLDTGYVYRTEGATVTASGDGLLVVDGETYAADSLPLDRAYAFDAMWHAMGGFYPETVYVT
ncbi:DUF3179 domain-containing protein [Halobaculum limi]|uniref:DUF3179 domain-containing protein n=1 Tax=Halobaculum limi TaxID=3031916 RepID=UPI002405E999|nr:DUF3179 domain-containing (seleno)protein [Halobaculum sp. YSMS11]